MSDMFVCNRCGATGNPPTCEHFAQPWSLEQIAEAHRAMKLPQPTALSRQLNQLRQDLREWAIHPSYTDKERAIFEYVIGRLDQITESNG